MKCFRPRHHQHVWLQKETADKEKHWIASVKYSGGSLMPQSWFEGFVRVFVCARVGVLDGIMNCARF